MQFSNINERENNLVKHTCEWNVLRSQHRLGGVRRRAIGKIRNVARRAFRSTPPQSGSRLRLLHTAARLVTRRTLAGNGAAKSEN